MNNIFNKHSIIIGSSGYECAIEAYVNVKRRHFELISITDERVVNLILMLESEKNVGSTVKHFSLMNRDGLKSSSIILSGRRVA